MKQNYISAGCVCCIYSTSGTCDEAQNGRTFCLNSTAHDRSALIATTARQATKIWICSYVPHIDVLKTRALRDTCNTAHTVCTVQRLFYGLLTVSRWQSFPCQRQAGIQADKHINSTSFPGRLVPGPSLYPISNRLLVTDKIHDRPPLKKMPLLLKSICLSTHKSRAQSVTGVTSTLFHYIIKSPKDVTALVMNTVLLTNATARFLLGHYSIWRHKTSQQANAKAARFATSPKTGNAEKIRGRKNFRFGDEKNLICFPESETRIVHTCS